MYQVTEIEFHRLHDEYNIKNSLGTIMAESPPGSYRYVIFDAVTKISLGYIYGDKRPVNYYWYVEPEEISYIYYNPKIDYLD